MQDPCWCHGPWLREVPLAPATSAPLTAQRDGSIAICLTSEPDTIDPALNSAVDGATMLIHLFSGLAKWEQDDSGKLIIAPDCAEELTEGVKNEDGTVTYTYNLRDGMVWSDGQPVTANDYVFAWQRAASTDLAADYGYMFEVVKGYDEMWRPTTWQLDNPDAELNVGGGRQDHRSYPEQRRLLLE